MRAPIWQTAYIVVHLTAANEASMYTYRWMVIVITKRGTKEKKNIYKEVLE